MSFNRGFKMDNEYVYNSLLANNELVSFLFYFKCMTLLFALVYT